MCVFIHAWVQELRSHRVHVEIWGQPRMLAYTFSILLKCGLLLFFSAVYSWVVGLWERILLSFHLISPSSGIQIFILCICSYTNLGNLNSFLPAYIASTFTQWAIYPVSNQPIDMRCGVTHLLSSELGCGGKEEQEFNVILHFILSLMPAWDSWDPVSSNNS